MFFQMLYCRTSVPHVLALDVSFGRGAFYHSVGENLRSTNFMSIMELLLLAEEFSGDLGSLQLKIHWAEILSWYVCFEIVQLFSVVFCVVWAVHKSDLQHVINETLNKWWPSEIGSCTDACVFMGLCVFFHRHHKCKVLSVLCAGHPYSLE